MEVLRVEKIGKSYGAKVAVSDVSFQLEKGVTAILGPNGAGKTTLIKLVTTLMPPTSGTLSLMGQQVKGRRSLDRVRGKIGYLPQNFEPDPAFTVANMVAYIAWLRGLEENNTSEAVSKALSDVNLTGQKDVRCKKLSGGMKQRVGLASATVGNPALVVLDEPTVGLDPEQREQFRSMIKNLPETAVFLSTHLIEDVEVLADRVLILLQGKLVFDGTITDLKKHAPPGCEPHRALEQAYLEISRTHKTQ